MGGGQSNPQKGPVLSADLTTKDIHQVIKRDLTELTKEFGQMDYREKTLRQYIDMRLKEIGDCLTSYAEERTKMFSQEQPVTGINAAPIVGTNQQQQGKVLPTAPSNQQAKEIPSAQAQKNALEKAKQTSPTKEDMEKMKEELKLKEEEIHKLKKDNQDIRLRLSKIAGDQLVANNPHIADLSDPNRPTKIAEMYRELYDNEYTDAMEALTIGGVDRKEASVILRRTLVGTYNFCQKKSGELIKTVEEAVRRLFDEYQMTIKGQSPGDVGVPDVSVDWRVKTGTENAGKSEQETTNLGATIVQPPVSMADKLAKLRKEVSMHLLPMVQKAYLKARWDKSCIQALKPFIRKCLQVTWCMVVMAPPLVFEPSDNTDGTKFDRNLYSACTKSGPMIDYVVWPTMYLHQGGAMLSKGIAEGRDEKQNTDQA